MTLAINSDDNFDSTKESVIPIIKKVIQDNDLFLSTNSINNLATHLTIAIIRIKSNNYIPLSHSQIETYKANSNYQFAKTLCEKITQKFNIQFPESELALVSMYLSTNNVLDVEFNSGFDLLDDDIYDIIRESIDLIHQETDHDFRSDDLLFIAIGLHLTPAIDRLLNDEQIDNPLLDQIKERHALEFNFAKILNHVVFTTYQKSFTDDELAYIALHFVVSMNRTNKNS